LFFFAGHETSSTTLTSAIFFLGKYPEIQEKAYQEVQHALQLQQEQQLLPETVKNLTYLTAILKETLRMNTPAPFFVSRVATEDTEILGYHIPKGTVVAVNVIPAHMSQKYWENPKKFDPDRWITGNDKKNTIFPFASGPRMCIASKFATLEMQVTTALLLLNFKWSLARSPEYKSKIVAFTLRPVGGMPIYLEKRN